MPHKNAYRMNVIHINKGAADRAQIKSKSHFFSIVSEYVMATCYFATTNETMHAEWTSFNLSYRRIFH